MVVGKGVDGVVCMGVVVGIGCDVGMFILGMGVCVGGMKGGCCVVSGVLVCL